MQLASRRAFRIVSAVITALLIGTLVSQPAMAAPVKSEASEAVSSVAVSGVDQAVFAPTEHANLAVSLLQTENFAPQSASFLGYVPAPAGPQNDCFQGSETGLPVVPVDRSLITAAATMALQYPIGLGLGDYASEVAAYEAAICTYEPKPSGVVRDGIIVDDEVVHITRLQLWCFNQNSDKINADLLLALAGMLTCPVPGVAIRAGLIQLETAAPLYGYDVISLVIQIVFQPLGRFEQALYIARCESTFVNSVVNSIGASGLFQCMPNHRDGAFRTIGVDYDTGKLDPAYNALAAAEIGTYDNRRGISFWAQWDCNPGW